MEEKSLLEDKDYEQINRLYDECLVYLKNVKILNKTDGLINDNDHFKYEDDEEPGYEIIKPITTTETDEENNKNISEGKNHILHKNYDTKTKQSKDQPSKSTGNLTHEKHYEEITNVEAVNNQDNMKTEYKIENEIIKDVKTEVKSERLRRLSQQLPKIIITQSNTSLNYNEGKVLYKGENWSKSEGNITRKVKRDPFGETKRMRKPKSMNGLSGFSPRRFGYGDFPRRLVSKGGLENVALISNVPFEKIRLLNDTFHTLINLRWRWIVTGTVIVHFLIWLVFAVFWYIAALAHYDFSPNPPARTCVTGGKDFLTIFLASVEAQTTIGFGDRAIDEECPESIFLFIMQLILGTGLSGVLTCVVYAKLTRPEKLSRDGVGFSKKAVISIRDGHLCLMMRAWDLNYDHIIGSEFSAHFVNTHRTEEGEMIRYYAHTLTLQQRQFLLWPVTLVHVIDCCSPLWKYTPELIAGSQYEITVSLKGASASMGTFTQSQTSYTPKEIVWGHRFPPVVKYDRRKQKYAIDHKKLDATEPVDTPLCSASQLHSSVKETLAPPTRPETPNSFSEKISAFVLERSSSFRNKSLPKPPSSPARPSTPSDFTEKVSGFMLQRSSSIRNQK